tara:strand:- start:4003 stop:4176 length:174 start_codon:yes stop_codon:yes gene_type:complete
MEFKSSWLRFVFAKGDLSSELTALTATGCKMLIESTCEQRFVVVRKREKKRNATKLL